MACMMNPRLLESNDEFDFGISLDAKERAREY